jgi:hypothetical protein
MEKNGELSHADRIFLLGVAVTALVGLIHLGQRLGEWRSKTIAWILGILAAILFAFWVYLLCLWIFDIDMRPWFTAHWLVVSLLLLVGVAIVLLRKPWQWFTRILQKLWGGPVGWQDEIHVKTREGVDLHIKRHPSADGLIAVLTNHPPHNINKCCIWVLEAISFDARQGRKLVARDSFGFGARAVATYQPILGGSVAKTIQGHESAWLIRVNQGHLEVGSTTNEGTLKWSSGDTSSEQIWMLDMSASGEGLKEWHFKIWVMWSSKSGAFHLRDHEP